MGMITNLIDRMFKASWERANRAERVSRAYAPLVSNDENQMASKTFTVREALNGKYLEFRRFKYNAHGPNEHEQCVYIVKDDETLIDAISVVLVLMDKES
jgi:hypothetical protein